MTYFFVLILLNILITSVFYLAQAKTRFGQLSYAKQQLIIGLSFSLLTCMATEFGTVQSGAVTNMRDAMPITAGLLFGGPAGIIAGLIGGIHRYLAVYWGAGSYTQVACSLSTILSGFISAAMRKYFFKNTCPPTYYTAIFCTGMESSHMMLVFLLHINDLNKAFAVIQQNALLMIFANSTAVILASSVYRLLDTHILRKAPISPFPPGKDAVPKLLIAGVNLGLIAAFISVILFIFSLQTRFSTLNVKEALYSSIHDIQLFVQKNHYDSLEQNGVEILDGMQPYHIHFYTNGEIFLVNQSFTVYGHTDQYGQPVNFPLDLSAPPHALCSTEFDGTDLFYLYEPAGNYYLVAALSVSEAMLFRNITAYLLIFLITILFSLLFFGSYVFIRKNIIQNIQTVTTAMMHLLDPEGKLGPIKKDEHTFCSITGEINSSFAALNHYYTGLMNQLQENHVDLKYFQYQSEHDELTGLLNRHGFKNAVASLEVCRVPLAFLFVDIDLFKQINDQYGHDIGDLILKKAAQHLRESIRPTDLAIRLGGDEFALMLIGCGAQKESVILKKMEKVNRSLLHPTDGLPPFSLSIGLAFSPCGYTDTLVQHADTALYRVKQSGRCRCSVYTEPDFSTDPCL